MVIKTLRISILCSVFLLQCFRAAAQDNRTQYPAFLANSNFSVNIGYIHYPFTNAHMEPGFSAESIRVPHLGVRIVLLGHQFNKYLSAQVSYMRPVEWVSYKNVNGDRSNHSVWMNVGGLTVKGHAPVREKLAVYGEAGLGVITRNGFEINQIPAVKNANYATFLFGAGLQYHVNNKWDLQLNSNYSLANKKAKQPYTAFFSGGFIYNMRPLPAEKVERNKKAGFIFPKNLIQAGYSTNALGYGVNNFVSEGSIPVFWGGTAEVERGVSLLYQRNLFHARKVFSFDWGASVSYWKSKKKGDKFYTVSLYPVFRLTPLRTKAADAYFYYSVAGPTLISKIMIDNAHTGKQFTFQDLMGIGIFAGKNRKTNAEIRIGHYSNGNIFPSNEGVKIPLTFNLGYTF